MTTPTDKRDILDALLKGGADDSSDEMDILAKMVHLHGEPPSPVPEPSKAPLLSRKKTKTTAQGKKRKSTHYLSGDIFQDLDEAKEKINQAIHRRHKPHITKSKIVDQALRMILKEFEEKGSESPLIQELLKEIDTK